jgi:hypothetical protein
MVNLVMTGCFEFSDSSIREGSSFANMPGLLNSILSNATIEHSTNLREKVKMNQAQYSLQKQSRRLRLDDLKTVWSKDKSKTIEELIGWIKMTTLILNLDIPPKGSFNVEINKYGYLCIAGSNGNQWLFIQDFKHSLQFKK